MSSPAHGFQAGTDPVMRAGTNGMFYYAGLVFNRTPLPGGNFGASAIVVSRYMDTNSPVGDPMQFLGTTLVAQGTAPGTFTDKPWIAVDVPRGGASSCTLNGQTFPGGNVYVTYTMFQRDQLHGAITFQRSTDCGSTWGPPLQFTDSSATRQGTAIAVDPNTGAVYVTWRQFAGFGVTDAIYVVRSVDGGQSFGPPVQVASISPFDQGSTFYSFRTNSYPSITVDGNSRAYVAWSQRGVGPAGDARILISTSTDGQSWSVPVAADNQPNRGHQFMPAITFMAGQLMLIYYDLRDDDSFTLYLPLGGGVFSETQTALVDPPSLVFTQFVDDTPTSPPAAPRQLRHMLDVRVAQGIPGAAPVFNSAPLSAYSFGSLPPDYGTVEQLQVNPPNFPMFSAGTQAYIGDYLDIAAVMFVLTSTGNWVYNTAAANDTVYHAVWTDNRDVRPPADGNWSNYTPVGTQGAPSLFDPTQLTPQSCIVNQEGMRNQNIYTASVTQGVVVASPNNAKSLLASQLKAFVLTLENTSATTQTFRLTVLNQPPGGRAVFSQNTSLPVPLTRLDISTPAFSTIARSVFLSSTVPNAQVRIQVQQITAPNGTVIGGGLQSTIVLNADPTDPNLNSSGSANEIYTPTIANPNIANPNIANPNIANPNIANPNIANPNIANPNIANPNIANPNIANPNIANPNIANPNIANPNIANPNIANPNIANPNIANPNIANPNISAGDLANGAVSDVSWTVTNTGNTAMAYTLKTLLNGAIPTGFKTQLMVYQFYSTPVSNNCTLGVDVHTKVLANIVNPVFEQASNNDVSDPGVTNSASNVPTVSLGPGETANVTLRIVNPDKTTNTDFNPLNTVITAITSHAANTNDVQQGNLQPKVAASQIIILTQALANASVGSLYTAGLSSVGGNGVVTWSSPSLPANGLTLDPATGVISGTPTAAGSLPITVTAADSGSPASAPPIPPRSTTRAFTLTITAPAAPAIASSSLPVGYPGGSYSSTLVATGGTATKTWSVTAGTLPAGLSLNAATGVISGTPTAVVTAPLTITVTDALLRSASKAFSLQIAPITLAFSLQPVNTNALVPDLVQLKATNAAGTGISGVQISLATVLSTGVTVSTVNVTTAAGGTIGSSVSLPAGVYHLVASVTGATSATSNPFSVAGAPTLSFVVPPSNTVAGQPITPPIQVSAQDGLTTPIPGLNVTLAIGTNPNGGTLTGTVTAATNASGIATFSNTAITMAGNGYTLVASATGATSIASNPFNISVATGGIKTIAGNTWVFAGGGPAVNAPLGDVLGAAVDATGNVYGADFNNNLVFKVSPAGTLTVVAGTGVAGSGGDGGPATSAQLNAPSVILLDPAGNLYIAEYVGSRVRKVTPAGIITTVAGNGATGFAGDGGPATAASLGFPLGMAMDAAGNLFISDTGNGRVRKVDTTGTITTVAGNGSTVFNGDGPATTVSVSFPFGLGFDPSGNLFIVDGGHSRIRKLSGGNLTTVAGSGTTGFTPDGSAALNSPLGNISGALAVDGSGNVYFSDTSRVRKINAAGILSTVAGDGVFGFSGDGGPAVDATLSFAGGLAFDGAGNLYFADFTNERLRKIDTAGNITTVAGNGQFKFGGDGGPSTSAFLNRPQGLSIDAGGNILVADGNTRVRKVVPGGSISTVAGNGIQGFSGNGGPATNAELSGPADVTADPAANFYITDVNNARVRKVDSLGTITDYAGNGNNGLSGDGGPATAAQLSPGGIRADAAGNLYIVDPSDNRVRKVSPAGFITTVAGNGTASFSGDGGPALSASFNSPSDVAVDAAGDLFITDTNNQRIRMVSPTGIITTIAGNGTAGFSGDGVATQVSLNHPLGIVVDPAGTVFFADESNQRIRKVDANGNLTTVAGTGTAGFGGDGGPASSALLSLPVGVAVDAAGNLLFTDSGNDRIREVMGVAAGVVTGAGASRLTIRTTSLPATSAGVPYSFGLQATGGSGSLGWSIQSGSLPPGLLLSGFTGQIMGTATGYGTFRFVVLVTDGSQTATASLFIQSNLAGGSSVSFVSQPTNVNAGQPITPPVQVKAQDSVGTGIAGVNITMAIGNNPSGGTLAGTTTVTTGANGIATFPNLSIDRAGNNYNLSASAAAIAPVSQPFNVLPAPGGIITVAGSSWVFTGAGGPATAAPIGSNEGIAVDAAGNQYFADSGNNMVFKVSSGGVLSVVAGTGIAGFAGDGGPATSARLNFPEGVALDAAGNIYITDSNNERVRKVDASGIINTVAGNGTFGFGGDSGPALGASLRAPQGLAVDGGGNLYIADSGNNRVRQVTPAGIISTVAGNGTPNYTGDGFSAVAATLNNPRGVAVDSGGNLYIADSNNHAIRKVSGGVIFTVAGGSGGYFGDGGPAVGAGAGAPAGVAVDAAGNIYFADNNNRVRMVNTSGIISTIAGNGLSTFAGDGGPATSASLANPSGVAVDSAGNVYINDNANRRVRKVSGGTISTLAGNGNFKFAGDGGPATSANLWGTFGAAPDAAGNLWIADSGNARIRKVSSTGVISTIAGNGYFSNSDFSVSGIPGPAANSILSSAPTYTVFDAAGNLYFSDTNNARVLKIDALGTISTFAGNGIFTYAGDGGPATAASLNSPRGLAFDAAGNLYIGDQNNNRVRKVDTTGTITTVAGNGAAGFSGDGGAAPSASLALPTGVAVDAAGNLYIGDAGNNRVRAVSPSGTITTVAGNGGGGFSGDGGPATSTTLNFPTGVAVDPGGNLYITDSNNNRIRKVDLTGVITTVAGNGNFGFGGDGGPAPSAQLAGPREILFDAAGNLFIGDVNNDRIREVASLGTLSPNSRLTITTASVPSTSLGAVYSAPLTAVGGSGVRTWSIVSGTLPGGIGINASTGLLSGTVTGAGTFPFTVQVTDSGQTALGQFTIQANLPAGSTVSFVTSPGTTPPGSPLNPPPQVRVLDASATPMAGVTVTVALSNNPSAATLGGATTALTGGSGIASFTTLVPSRGGDGFTLVANVGALTAVSQPFNVVSSPGGIVTVAGSQWVFTGSGGPASNAPISPDRGMLVDALGNLIVADKQNHQVEKITPTGVLTVIAGTGVAGFSGDGGPATSAQLHNPEGLALDAAGNLYVADSWNNRIRKVGANGVISTIAGVGNYDFFGDGGLAIAAAFRSPTGVAVASDGTVYVADPQNNRVRRISPAGIITTLAGAGTAGFSGDNGPASGARLNNPQSVALDSAGNLFISDTSNNRIRKVTPAGIITTFGGSGVCCNLGEGGQAVNAWMNNPVGLGFDASGNLFFADQFSRLIRKITPAGIITTIAGSGSIGFSGDGGPALNAQFDQPTGVAVDAAGNVYAIDSFNKRVRKINTGGTITTFAGNGLFKFNGDGSSATSSFLNAPQGVAVDSGGNLYISDNGNLRVRRVSNLGVMATVAGTGIAGFSGDGGPGAAAQISDFTTDVRADAAGDLLIDDDGNGRVRLLPSGGFISSPLSGVNPRGVATDAAGNLYVAMENANIVVKVDSLGNRTTVAGNGTPGFSGDGGPATAAQLNAPHSVALDRAGNLYITDSNNSRIRRVTPGGIITTLAGNGGVGFSGDGGLAVNATLNGYLQGIAVDASGNVYFADINNNRVRKVDLAGIITTVAGNGNYAYSGDGGPATSASLASPWSVDIDALGNLYIADTGNDRIREVLAPGATPLPGSRLTITTTSLPDGFVNSNYTTTVQTMGGAGSLTFSVISGALPASFTLNSSTGVISGRPTTDGGSFPLTVQVQDTGSPQQTTTAAFVLRIGPLETSTLGFVTQPSNAVASGILSPVQVQIVCCGSVPGQGALVTLALGSNQSGATLSGTLSVLTDATGTATFSDLSVDKGGVYDLIATVGPLAATSSAFTVTPPSGRMFTIAGSTWAFNGNGGLAINAPLGLGFDSGVATDSSGNVFVADQQNQMVFKIDAGGNLAVVAGTGTQGYNGDFIPAMAAQLNDPTGVALDSAGNLYIADRDNHRIRRVDTSGFISTVAGDGTCCALGSDGVAAVNAKIAGPAGVAFDSSGNLYIAEQYNHRIRKVNGAGTITTVAGTGVCCYNGDGISATSAELNSPEGVAVDGSGNIYIADTQNYRVREVSGGIINTIAGTGIQGFAPDGPATTVNIDRPVGVAFDGGGTLTFAELGSNRIRKVSSGNMVTVAGNGTFAFTGDGGAALGATMAQPSGIAFDSSGNLYIADGLNKRIRKVDTSGNIATFAGNGLFKYTGDGGPGSGATLDSPTGLAVDSSGNVYIGDGFNQVVRKVGTSGTITTFAGIGRLDTFSGDGGPATSAPLSFPFGVGVDGSNNVYVAESYYRQILRKINTSNTISTVKAFGFPDPTNLTVDSSGNAYVVDGFSNNIRKITTGGTVTVIAGNGNSGFNGDNILAVNASLSNPQQVAVDAAGNLYIADAGNNRIRKVDTSGTITTVAGTGTFGFSGDGGLATSAQLARPSGIAVDSHGNLYIADSNNQRIRKVSGGTITTVAGNGIFGVAGDGGLATAGNLANPTTVVVDQAGAIYFVDNNSSRVRKIVP